MSGQVSGEVSGEISGNGGRPSANKRPVGGPQHAHKGPDPGPDPVGGHRRGGAPKERVRGPKREKGNLDGLKHGKGHVEGLQRAQTPKKRDGAHLGGNGAPKGQGGTPKRGRKRGGTEVTKGYPPIEAIDQNDHKAGGEGRKKEDV